ncbi:MAG: hypothetical protein QM765_26485 [Myxococcales bacterium]
MRLIGALMLVVAIAAGCRNEDVALPAADSGPATASDGGTTGARDAEASDAAVEDAAQVDADAATPDAASDGADGAVPDAGSGATDAASGGRADSSEQVADASEPAAGVDAAAEPDAGSPSPGLDATVVAGDAALGDSHCDAGLANDPQNCGACGRVCAAPTGATPTCSSGLCGYSARASDLPGFWSTTAEGPLLSLVDDNRALISPFYAGGVDSLVDLSTHATTSVPGVGGRRVTIAQQAGGALQYKLGGYENYFAETIDGTIVYTQATGCCNGIGAWFAVDPSTMRGYLTRSGGVSVWNLTSGAETESFLAGSHSSFAYSYLANGNTLYAASNDGYVTQFDLATKAAVWSTPVENWSHSAVAAVGPSSNGATPGIAVVLIAASTSLPGRVALLASDGTLKWKLSNYLVRTSPVWSGAGKLVIGTWALSSSAGAVAALSPADGSENLAHRDGWRCLRPRGRRRRGPLRAGRLRFGRHAAVGHRCGDRRRPLPDQRPLGRQGGWVFRAGDAAPERGHVRVDQLVLRGSGAVEQL